MFNTLLQAAAEQPNAFMSFLPLILILVVFYFFMIRPQQKRQKELNKFRDELKKGDHVITTGGVYGKVSKIDGNKITLTVSENVDIVFDKSAIAAQAEA
ncbi:MAG: preprotein translocase subunit YajC [Bacteroidales bacterium]|nr:preprotein translocase subunit YajC [Bacteroidales bacterium]